MATTTITVAKSLQYVSILFNILSLELSGSCVGFATVFLLISEFCTNETQQKNKDLR